MIAWIKELGGIPENHVLLVSDGKTAIRDAESFVSFETIRTPFTLPDESHPRGANWMFETALKHLQRSGNKLPILWLEPDAVPLRRGWLQEIEREYSDAKFAGKKILACVTRLGDGRYPKQIPSGIAVYPPNAWSYYSKLAVNRKIAWDIQFADKVIPMVYPSKTIANVVNHKNPPTFKAGGLELSDIPKSAAIWHPCKDDSMINLLRKSVVKPSVYLSDFSVVENLIPSVLPQKPSNSNRIIHCVERHRQKSDDAMRRVLFAQNSWIDLYMTGAVTPCHVWNWNYKRSALQIGDKRDLPYLKDILSKGLTRSSNGKDVVLLTNDDTVLHPDIASVILKYLKDVPVVSSGRLNYKTGTTPSWKIDETKGWNGDIGRDLFAFRKEWLMKHWQEIPDFILGELEWDLVLSAMIRSQSGENITLKTRDTRNPKCEIPAGYVWHEDHRRHWDDASLAQSPAKRHNIRLMQEWYSKNKFNHLITVA